MMQLSMLRLACLLISTGEVAVADKHTHVGMLECTDTTAVARHHEHEAQPWMDISTD